MSWPTRAVVFLTAAFLLVTTLSQHPHRGFDRFRRWDRLGLLIPNWRFFAPTPAMEDFHLLHRTLSPSGEESEWEETVSIAPRRLSQLVWFPTRRREKAIFDLSSELIGVIPNGDDAVLSSTAYRTLSAMTRETIRLRASEKPPAGFQFMIAKSAGFEDAVEPDYLLISPYTEWNSHGRHNQPRTA